MANEIRDCIAPDRNPRKPNITLPKGVTSVSLTHEDGDLAVATVKAPKGEKADKADGDDAAEEAGDE